MNDILETTSAQRAPLQGKTLAVTIGIGGGWREGTFSAAQCRSRYSRIVSKWKEAAQKDKLLAEVRAAIRWVADDSCKGWLL